MRLFALFLLIANVFLASYTQINALANAPDPSMLPLKPEKMTVLTSRQVASLGPSKVAQLNVSCAEWGPFAERERANVQAILDPLQLGKTLSVVKTDMGQTHWVNIPPKSSRAAMDRALKELTRLKVGDAVGVTEDGAEQYAISLGVFQTEALAKARLKEVQSRGIKTAKISLRTQSLPGVIFIIREPAQATVAALEAAREKLPSSSLNFVSCRDRSN